MNSRSAASIAPRLVAVVALGSALALGTTGCTFITHQATTIPYSASDGVNIDALRRGVRNALSNQLWNRTHTRPMIIPVVMEV